MKKYDKAVFIGRMQPLHNGHLINIIKAMELSDDVHIILGSGRSPRSTKNPFTDNERIWMVVYSIQDCFDNSKWKQPIENKFVFDIDGRKITVNFHSIMDKLYSDNAWVQDVQAAVAQRRGENVIQVGHDKDETGRHLKMFPQWDFYDSEVMYRHNGTEYNASEFREDWFNAEEFPESWKDCIPKGAIDVIKGFDNRELAEEYRYLKEYPEKWGKGPFVTVDSIVIALGHVLMIKRGANPGKGNYALPGGFLEPEETILDGTLRELKEETKIKVPPKILRKSVTNQHVFDHPNRSLRGRIITFASLIELDSDEGLPRVKGGDDADEAFWLPLSKLDLMTHLIHEDHYSIIKYFV